MEKWTCESKFEGMMCRNEIGTVKRECVRFNLEYWKCLGFSLRGEDAGDEIYEFYLKRPDQV